MPMTRILLAGVLTLALATACQPAPPPAAPPAPGAPALAPAPAAPAAPAAPPSPSTGKGDWYQDPWSLGYEKPTTTGGTFVFANTSGPANLDPFGPNLRAHGFIDNVYDGLMGRTLVPGKAALTADIICRLCESWEVKADKVTYSFKLRPNVKFHDGQPFVSEDVKFSLEKALDPKTGYEFRSLFSAIDKVDTPDKGTVVITTKKANADFIRALGWGVLPMVPKHAYDANVDLAKTVVGTGAFKMDSFNTDTAFVGVKNPDFWIPGRPLLDRIEGRYIADFTTRQSAFLTKQLDVITVDNSVQMKPIQAAAPAMKAQAYAVNHAPVLWLASNKPPFSDKRVRQAMHLAIDRDEINVALASGLAVPYTLPGSPPEWQPFTLTIEELGKAPGFRKAKEQDRAEAKRLLAEAGYANGFKTTSMHAAGFTHNPEWNEAAAGQLKTVGIDVEIQPLEVGALNKKYFECTFDMYVNPSAASNSMPTRNYSQWITGGSENYCKFSNAEYDKLVDEQSAELDPQKRWAIVKKIQQILLDEVPAIGLPDRAPFAGWHPYLHNWRNYGSTWTYPLYPIAELIWVEKK